MPGFFGFIAIWDEKQDTSEASGSPDLAESQLREVPDGSQSILLSVT